ncbi:MAG: chromate transporter [Firmicutes bacterium]|nr:chromate transporter [Bacillota bacterium]
MKRIREFFRNNIYWNLFECFFQLGLFTIGGGIAMIPIMQEKVCDERKWMTEEEVLDCLAVCQSLPGVIAINMATYIGYYKKGLKGALVSTFGVLIPSFVIIILVVTLLGRIDDNRYVQGALMGFKAAATGLIAYAAANMVKKTMTGVFPWVVAIIALVLIAFLGVDAVWVILGGILIGEVKHTIDQAKGREK